MARAHSSALLDGRPADLAEQFGTLLRGNVMVGLLLGVDEQPTPREVAARARATTEAFLQLHQPPNVTGRRPRLIRTDRIQCLAKMPDLTCKELPAYTSISDRQGITCL